MSNYKIDVEMDLGNIINKSRDFAQALNEFADHLEQIEKKYDGEPQKKKEASP